MLLHNGHLSHNQETKWPQAGRRADPFVVILPACMYVKSLLLFAGTMLAHFRAYLFAVSLSLSPYFFASHFPAPDVSEWKNGGGGGEGREREKSKCEPGVRGE